MYYCLCRLQRMYKKKNHKENPTKQNRLRASHGVIASVRGIHLLLCGILHRLQVDLCSSVRLPWSTALSPWPAPQGQSQLWQLGPSCHSFCTTLGVCTAVPLKYLLSPPWLKLLFPLFGSVTPEALPWLPVGSALVCGGCVLEPDGIVSIRYRENLQQSPTEATPKPRPENLKHSSVQNRGILKAIANPLSRTSAPFYTAQTVRIDGLRPFFP